MAVRLILLILPLSVSFVGALPLPERNDRADASAQDLEERTSVTTDDCVAHWVLFTGKGFWSKAAVDQAIEQAASMYNIRAVHRRIVRRTAPGLFDERDLPVSSTYVEAVVETGAQLRTQSRWLNGVSVLATEEQIASIAEFPFVKSISPVKRLRMGTIKQTADGRIKPEVLAQGVAVWIITPGGDTGFEAIKGA